MKRKFFAMLMSVVLCAGLLPSGVMADVPEQAFEEEAAEPEYLTDSGIGDAESAEPEDAADTGTADTVESEPDFSIQDGTGEDGAPVPGETMTKFLSNFLDFLICSCL